MRKTVVFPVFTNYKFYLNSVMFQFHSLSHLISFRLLDNHVVIWIV